MRSQTLGRRSPGLVDQDFDGRQDRERQVSSAGEPDRQNDIDGVAGQIDYTGVEDLRPSGSERLGQQLDLSDRERPSRQHAGLTGSISFSSSGGPGREFGRLLDPPLSAGVGGDAAPAGGDDLLGDGPGEIVDGVDPGRSQLGGDVGLDPRDRGQAFASGARAR